MADWLRTCHQQGDWALLSRRAQRDRQHEAQQRSDEEEDPGSDDEVPVGPVTQSLLEGLAVLLGVDAIGDAGGRDVVVAVAAADQDDRGQRRKSPEAEGDLQQKKQPLLSKEVEE